MSIIKNKKLYVRDDSGYYQPFHTIDQEIFLTADLKSHMNYFDYIRYQNAITSPISETVIRLYILNEDETIREDVSEYVISWNVSFNHQQGQTRSCNFTLYNGDGFWNISPVVRRLWKGIKYRFDVGIFYNGVVYWKKCGIFTPENPNLSLNNSKTISISMLDKFALLDGKLGGKQHEKVKIPVGTQIKKAIQICLETKKNENEVFDSKEMFFPEKYTNEVTPYTINQSENTSLGEIIIELVNILSCDVFYNDDGNLIVEDGIDDEFYQNRPIQWFYNNNEIQYKDANLTLNFGELINRIVVKGAIKNGKQFKGEAVNDNPFSQGNISMNDTYTCLIEDNMIYSDELCNIRAKYELKKKSILSFKLQYKSIFVPHLLQNHFVKWTNSDLNIRDKTFVIQSISISSDSPQLMDISLCNLDEINL